MKTNYIKLIRKKEERILDKSYRSHTSYSTGISPRRSHCCGNFIFNSGNSNVIINTDALQPSRNTNNRFPEGVGGSPGSGYNHVVSSGNGGSPNSAGSGNPVYINHL